MFSFSERLKGARPPRTRRGPLLPLAEVTQRLDLVEQQYVGVRAVPLNRILGTLDRTRDFDRRFRPGRTDQVERLNALRRAFPNNDFPPIAVYEIGGAYFVSDGHHRVALAHERGMLEIDAEVTHFPTRYALSPEVDIRQIIHTQQQQQFLRQSGLARSRPNAAIELSCPQGYPELLELIKAHGYDLQRTSKRFLPSEEVAADWFDSVYMPAVAALRAERVTEVFADKQDADLFLWMHQQHRRLLTEDSSATYAQAARRVRQNRPNWRQRRALQRQRTTPLQPVA